MATKVTGVVLRQRQHYLGWPGGGYPMERYQKEYPQRAVEMGRELGMEVSFAETIYGEEGMAKIYAEEGMTKFLEEIEANPPDGLLLIPLSMYMWDLVDKITQTGLPTVIFASIGTVFTGHVRARSRQKGIYYISSLDFRPVRTGLKMIDVKKRLTEERVLLFKGNEKEPVDSVVENLGVKVKTISRERAREEYEKVEETDEVRKIAEEYIYKALKVVEPTKEDMINAARMYVALKNLLDEYEGTSITMDCLGLVRPCLIDTTPCIAFSKLNDEGIPAACEADMDAMLTMLLLKHMFSKPSFINDPVPETVHNTLVAAHCTSPTRLDGYGSAQEPFILRSHKYELPKNTGPAMQVLWREGQEITLAKFQGPTKMLVGSGKVVGNVDTPPAGGCRTQVEVEMKEVKDVRDLKGFHQLLMYGAHARELKDFCQLLGVEVIPM